MIIWLVTVGEPLPLPGEETRLWRCGLLAKVLASRGHEVTWWTSTFDHIRKQHFRAAVPGGEARVLGGVELRWLHGIAYRKNLSVARLVNHAQLALDFRQRTSADLPRPQVIVAALPTIELGYVAARLARRWRIPLVIDVRDLWPDIFIDAAPAPLRKAARALLTPYFIMTRNLVRAAASLVAVSSHYLEWGAKVAGRPVSSNDAVFALGYEPAVPGRRDRLEILRELSLDSDSLVAIFAGSFGLTYDLVTVIGAARILHGRGDRRLKLVICGTGEREQELRLLAADLPNVVFTGLLAARKLAAVFERGVIGLAAYAMGAPQGIPNKFVEYSCAGLAVVSSLNGEARDLIAESACGISYSAGNPAELAECLGSLLADPERLDRMRANAVSLYRSRFSAMEVYGSMADHIERVALAGASTAPGSRN